MRADGHRPGDHTGKLGDREQCRESQEYKHQRGGMCDLILMGSVMGNVRMCMHMCVCALMEAHVAVFALLVSDSHYVTYSTELIHFVPESS